MQATFRLPRRDLYTGLIFLLFFLAAEVVTVWWRGEFSVETRLSMVALSTLVWGGMGLLAVYQIALYFRYSISINDDLITETTLANCRSIQPSEVEQAIWQNAVGGGCLVFVSGATWLKVCFDRFEGSQVNELIQWCRKNVPTDRQEGWPAFCHTIALPRRLDVEQPMREARRDEIRLDRKRVDWFMSRLALVNAFLCVLLACWIKEPACLWATLVIPVVWIPLRFMTSREGNIQKVVQRSRRDRSILLFLAGLTLFGLGTVAWIKALGLKEWEIRRLFRWRR